MFLEQSGSVVFLQASLFNRVGGVSHAFSTRLGGWSRGPLASMNMAFHNGDREAVVLANRQHFFETFGLDYLLLTGARQEHGTEIGFFGPADRGHGALPQTARRSCDALITTQPGLTLAAYAADCLLLFFYSPRRRVVALAHAGWRGTLGGIAGKLVERLRSSCHCEPAELLVALSPAVCQSCYSLDDEQANLFTAAGWGEAAGLQTLPGGRRSFDLENVNRLQLLQAGVQDGNVAGGGWCTSCREDLFYSYRRDRGRTGRMIGFITINP